MGYLKLSSKEFWKLTLKELIIRINGERERIEAEFNRDKWLIYQQVSLSRMKRLPPIKQFLKGITQARKLSGEELENRKDHHKSVSDAYIEKMLKKGVRVNGG